VLFNSRWLMAPASRRARGAVPEIPAPARLKQKLLASIVAIHVLEAFLNIDSSFDATKTTWLVAVHLASVISALLLAISDRWSSDR